MRVDYCLIDVLRPIYTNTRNCNNKFTIPSTCQPEPEMKLLLILSMANLTFAMSYFKVIKGKIPMYAVSDSSSIVKGDFSMMKRICSEDDDSCKFGFYCMKGVHEECSTIPSAWGRETTDFDGAIFYEKSQVCCSV